MLCHVASLLSHIFYRETEICLSRSVNLLDRCYKEKNLLGFICVYSQIRDNSNIVVAWSKYTDYLVQAIALYPPSRHVASNILDDYADKEWSIGNEAIIKLLLQQINYYYNNCYLSARGYYHLLPNAKLKDNPLKYLSKALQLNNTEEVKYILKQTSNISELVLYEAITSPVDNKASLALLMPRIHTFNEKVNAIIISAYVNNKLPDISGDTAQLPIIKILAAHFDNTELVDIIVDYNVFYLSHKFRLSDKLFTQCMELSPVNLMHNIHKYAQYAQNRICEWYQLNNPFSDPCTCDECSYMDTLIS